VCFIFLYNFRSKLYCWVMLEILKEMCVSLHVYYCYPVLTKCGISQQILVKLSNIKFHKNLYSSSWVVTCRQTDKHGKPNGHIFCNFIMYMPKKKWPKWGSNKWPSAHETRMLTHKLNSICSLNDKHSFPKYNIKNTRFVGLEIWHRSK
jgi:hypothetical protein